MFACDGVSLGMLSIAVHMLDVAAGARGASST
jgi:hypothetical protein